MPLARTLLLVPLLALAVFSFVFVRSHQGDGGVLVAAQRHAQALTPDAVARVVKTAPDPVTHAAGVRAACASEGQGELHNPWRCSIRYASGRRIEYLVRISADGSYRGENEGITYRGHTRRDPGNVSGCCIVIP